MGPAAAAIAAATAAAAEREEIRIENRQDATERSTRQRLPPSSLAPVQIGIFYRRRSILPFTAARALEEPEAAVSYLTRLGDDHIQVPRFRKSW